MDKGQFHYSLLLQQLIPSNLHDDFHSVLKTKTNPPPLQADTLVFDLLKHPTTAPLKQTSTHGETDNRMQNQTREANGGSANGDQSIPHKSLQGLVGLQ